MPAKPKAPARAQRAHDSATASDELFQSVSGLIRQMQTLSQDAAEQAEPIVNTIILRRRRDVQRIEHTLDQLLSFCHSPAPLVLFKRLCCYYWTLDPHGHRRLPLRLSRHVGLGCNELGADRDEPVSFPRYPKYKSTLEVSQK